MDKTHNLKSQDCETIRSILKANSSRQNRNASSSTKNGYGIFKRTSMYEAKSLNDVPLSTSIRVTRSESVAQNMDNFRDIIRAKSPEKHAKKVQFYDNSTKTGNDDENKFRRLLDCDDNALNDQKFRPLLKSSTDTSLVQLIDDKTDNLLDLLSTIPTEVSPREDPLQNNINLLSKMTSIERICVISLIVLFCIMILKHFRYDWLLPSTMKPQLTGAEIITLMGRNVKRMCEKLARLGWYFW